MAEMAQVSEQGDPTPSEWGELPPSEMDDTATATYDDLPPLDLVAPPSLEQRLLALEEDMRTIKAALNTLPEALDKEKSEIRKNMASFEGIQKNFNEVAENASRSRKLAVNLEKRVEGVKKDATSGVVVSILIFSSMLIISLFIRG